MIITKEQLLHDLSSGELWNKTKEKAVIFYMYNGRFTELCVNDLKGFDVNTSTFFTHTGIKIALSEIDYLKVIERL